MKEKKSNIPMGKALCASLGTALTQIRSAEFHEIAGDEMVEIIETSIQTAMTDIASLFCEDDSWESLCTFILSTGAELSEDFLNSPDR